MPIRLKSVLALGLLCLPALALAFDIPLFWLPHATRDNPHDPLGLDYVAPTATPWAGGLGFTPTPQPGPQGTATAPATPTAAATGQATPAAATDTATPSPTPSPTTTQSQTRTATSTPTPVQSPTATPTTTPTAQTCQTLPKPSGVVAGNNAFTLALFNQVIAASTPGSNVTLSPFSVATDLSMAYQGASGANAVQMAGVLGYPASATTVAQETETLLKSLSKTSAASGLTLTVADGFWMNDAYSFVAATESLLASDYGAVEDDESYADATTIVDQINSWVSSATQGLIPSILAPGDVNSSTTVFDLVNAVYFNAQWASPFEGDAFSGPFATAAGTTVTAAYMNQIDEFNYYQNSQVQVLEMPYDGGTYGMVLVLPQSGVSLSGVESSLTAAQLLTWTAEACSETVNLTMPTLNLQTGPLGLIPELQALGMTDAFDPESGNFTALVSGTDPIYIDVVKHEAVVIVNQQGTQAAAATVTGGADPGIALSPQATFDADAPFLWFILDHSTGSILFISQVDNPDNP